jgi:hypothetical protein
MRSNLKLTGTGAEKIVFIVFDDEFSTT